MDVANIGTVNGNNIERPNVAGDPNNGPKTTAQWFNKSAFTLPAGTPAAPYVSEILLEIMSSGQG